MKTEYEVKQQQLYSSGRRGRYIRQVQMLCWYSIALFRAARAYCCHWSESGFFKEHREPASKALGGRESLDVRPW